MDIAVNNKLIAEFHGLVYGLCYVIYPNEYSAGEVEIVSEREEAWHKKGETHSYFDSINSFGEPDYHENWNSLMEVIEKIRELNIASVLMSEEGTYISEYKYNDKGKRYISSGCIACYAVYDDECKFSYLTATYLAVVGFVKWYNEYKLELLYQ